ncbi:MAG TPA: cytochrome c [Terriglobales bacterium]|nr:cytochrome c [Terriglobales bacterium]
MHKSNTLLGPILLLAGVFLFLCQAPLRADDSASLYHTKCAVCHAEDGSGNSVMGKKLGAKDLRSDEVQKKSDSELNDVITNGMGKTMPAYKDKLSAGDIKGLVSYIRELAKKK